MLKSKFQAAFLVAGVLGAGCNETVRAQEEAPKTAPAPAPAPAVKPDEPTKPAAQRPIDEGAIRALAEEVARLRSQIADLQKAKQAPAPNLVEPVRPGEAPATPEAEPRFGSTDSGAAGTAPAVVEREVPVYVDREVPVYVDREVVVERPTTVVLERVVYGNDCCDQWIPVRHVHYIGCGHHYYGCSCHDWYYDLGPTFSLSFTYFPDDHDDHHDRDDDHHGNGGGHHDGNGGHGNGHGGDGHSNDHRGSGSDRDSGNHSAGRGTGPARNGQDKSPSATRPDEGRPRGTAVEPRTSREPARFETRPSRPGSDSANSPADRARQRARDEGDARRTPRVADAPQRAPDERRARPAVESARPPRDRTPDRPRLERQASPPPQPRAQQPRPQNRPSTAPRQGRSNDAPPPPPRHHKKG